MSEPRDPRTDPRAGDCLLRYESFRSVVEVCDGNVIYQSPDVWEDMACTLEEWRTWARLASVMQFGSPGPVTPIS